MLAAIARRDYEQRRERQRQGIEKAQAAGKYRGRKIDLERYNAINRLLASGSSWSIVQHTIGCSRSTISSAIKHASRMIAFTQRNTQEDKPEQSVALVLWLHVENGSKFTRGKKAVRDSIFSMLLSDYQAQKLNEHETRIVVQFSNDTDLKARIDEMLNEIYRIAGSRNCEIIDLTIQEEKTDRYWNESDGGWKSM